MGAPATTWSLATLGTLVICAWQGILSVTSQRVYIVCMCGICAREEVIVTHKWGKSPCEKAGGANPLTEKAGKQRHPQSKMFTSRRAWFSRSVARELCDLWVAEGGVITNQKDADYLFSSDASHPDTKRIHESLEYLEDGIEVFHSSYLSSSANSEIKTTVPLGHFLLPPSCLQEEIREKIGSFIWEQITEPQRSPPSVPAETSHGRYDQQLNDSRELERSKDHQTPGMLERMRVAYLPLQDYPANNMVTGYDSAKEMKKYLGEICDFIPGCSGYLVYCIQNETSFFSDRKPNLKRKL